MTRYEAFISKDWQKHGLAQLLVARIKDTGVELSWFLLDIWCLGVKDAYYVGDATQSELTDMLRRQIPEDMRERLHPACAKKLVEGAVAYAESLGFAPHRELRKAKRVLTALDSADCPEIFTYGNEGRPCYVVGPDDTEERIEKILNVLDAKFGPDGYDFVEDEDDEDGPNSDDSSDRLYDYIEAYPSPTFPNYTEFSGLIAALHVCPGLVMPTQLAPLFLSPERPEWPNARDAYVVLGSLGKYWNQIAHLFTEAEADAEAPGSYIVDIHIDDEEDHTLDDLLPHWCRGFMRTTELWPEAWGDALARPALAPHFALLRSLADTAGESGEPTDEDTEAVVTQAVLALYRALKAERRPMPDAP